MAIQCCNCGSPVENETAHTTAPACNDCRHKWAAAEINRATALLTANGYHVVPPQVKE